MGALYRRHCSLACDDRRSPHYRRYHFESLPFGKGVTRPVTRPVTRERCIEKPPPPADYFEREIAGRYDAIRALILSHGAAAAKASGNYLAPPRWIGPDAPPPWNLGAADQNPRPETVSPSGNLSVIGKPFATPDGSAKLKRASDLVDQSLRAEGFYSDELERVQIY